MAITERLRLEDFLRLPEEEPALEFADGEVAQKVSPKGRHSAIQRALVRVFDRALEAGGRGQVFPELRTTFAGASYVPDTSLYRTERIPSDASGTVVDDFTVSPDVAVEIASPGQSTNALVRRCLWYVDHGVQIAVLIDPADRSAMSCAAARSRSPWVNWTPWTSTTHYQVWPSRLARSSASCEHASRG